MTDQPVAGKALIEKIFDEAAESYDQAGPRIFTQFGLRLVELLPLQPGQRLLDVATGTGAVLLPAAQRIAPGGEAVGIDLSAGMLAETARQAQAAALKNVTLRKMDAEQMEFPDQSFDVVTCAFALFMFPNLPGVLGEMVRVCKPGGKAGFAIFGRPPLAFEPAWPILFDMYKAYQVGIRMPSKLAYKPEELEQLLRQAGWEQVQITRETHELIYPTLEDWWALQLTVGPRAVILGMDEATRARFKHDYFERLSPHVSPDGLHLALSVLYARAGRS